MRYQGIISNFQKEIRAIQKKDDVINGFTIPIAVLTLIGCRCSIICILFNLIAVC